MAGGGVGEAAIIAAAIGAAGALGSSALQADQAGKNAPMPGGSPPGLGGPPKGQGQGSGQGTPGSNPLSFQSMQKVFDPSAFKFTPPQIPGGMPYQSNSQGNPLEMFQRMYGR